MTPRFHVEVPLAAGRPVDLPPRAARHAQVLRLQPGDAVVLFDGRGGQWSARIERLGRREVTARPEQHDPVERELTASLSLALGMPANDRMDSLIEKATELGAAQVQPLVTERSVLRLSAERAQTKTAHWRAVAASACEQCGRNRLPEIAPALPLAAWLAQLPAANAAEHRWLLSLAGDAAPLSAGAGMRAWVLSGPEGGLSRAEELSAQAAGFVPATLGRRVLRADTAPLAALTLLGACT